MNAPIPTSGLDPALVTLITGAITAVAGFAAAKVGIRSKQVEKAPEVQDQINKAVAGLISHYTTALEQEKARHADHIQEMDARLDRAVARIEQLVTAMRHGGMEIPDEA